MEKGRMPGQDNEPASLHTVGHLFAVVVDQISFSFLFLLDIDEDIIASLCKTKSGRLNWTDLAFQCGRSQDIFDVECNMESSVHSPEVVHLGKCVASFNWY